MWKKLFVVSLLVSVAAIYFKFASKARPGVVAVTENGKVQGVILESRGRREFYAWHKIPFAQPPVGKLRFADPLPPSNWEGVLDGSNYAPQCAQVPLPMMITKTPGSEDCLYLNVYAPKKIYDHKDITKAQLPVLVFVHGGAYMGGAPDMFGANFVMDEHLIFVTITYRLHILGFLTTGDKVVRGNMGLKDQSMALKWVQKNIHHFGGNPKDVTVYGSSAGAGSAHNHMLSPLSKGLIHKAFSQSGAATNSWGILSMERALEKTREVARHFKCPTDNNQKLVDCLRAVKIQDLLAHYSHIWDDFIAFNPLRKGDGFAPVVEAVNDSEAFLAEHPMKIIASGKFERVPLMIGMTTHEGFMTAAYFHKNPESLSQFEAEATNQIEQLFEIPGKKELAEKIWEFYFPSAQRDSMTFSEKVNRYADLFGDVSFNFDIREAVYYQRQFSPVYYYVHNRTEGASIGGDMFVEVTGKYPLLAEIAFMFLKKFVRESILGLESPFEGIINHSWDTMYYGPPFGMSMFSAGSSPDEYSKDLVRMLRQFMTDDTKMTFREEPFPATPNKGPIRAFEFKNEYARVIDGPFQERMEFLHSLGIRSVKL